MSVTSGFFNSSNGDRRYNAEQMSAIFDGIITDGVFANIGTSFGVRADEGLKVTVGIGRAWFNSTWILNDSILSLVADASELVLDRIDAVIFEIDRSEFVRAGNIKIIKGMPGSTPKRPEMTHTKGFDQYPLAYIYRKAGSSAVVQADITNMIGTSECPYITGILKTQNIDNIVAQWEGQWNKWFADVTADNNVEAAEWMTEMKADFETWFNALQATLDSEVATELANNIVELQDRFLILATEHCVYTSIDDNTGDTLKDNFGNPIGGKTVFATATDFEASLDIQNDKIDRINGGVSISLSAEAWSLNVPYTQTKNVSGVTPDDIPIIGILLAGDATPDEVARQNKAWGCVDRAESGYGTITFYCYSHKPVADFSVLAKGVG